MVGPVEEGEDEEVGFFVEEDGHPPTHPHLTRHAYTLIMLRSPRAAARDGNRVREGFGLVFGLLLHPSPLGFSRSQLAN